MIPFVSNDNTIRWKFENLNDWDGIDKCSEEFKIGPTKWNIRIQKNMLSGTNYLGIYLRYTGQNPSQKNWFCRTKRTIKLINQTGQKSNISKTATSIHDHIFPGYGWHQFHKWDDLIKDGYMKDNSIIVEIDFSFEYYDFSNIPNLTDIILKVDNYEFHTSKAILCLHSEYFYDLFVNKNHRDTVIEIKDVRVFQFQYFLASFYPDFDGVNEENYEILNKLAEQYKVSRLQKKCEKFWKKTTEILMNNLVNAEKNNDSELLKECIESINSIQKIKHVRESEEFRDFKESTKHAIMIKILRFV